MHTGVHEDYKSSTLQLHVCRGDAAISNPGIRKIILDFVNFLEEACTVIHSLHLVIFDISHSDHILQLTGIYSARLYRTIAIPRIVSVRKL